MRKLLIMLIMIPGLCYGLSCPKSYDVDKIAKELIRIEFSGVHISGQKESRCLKQSSNKHFVVEYDGSNENYLGKTHTVKDLNDLTITSTKLVDPDVYLYKSEYVVKATNAEGKEEMIKDSISFFLYKGDRNQANYGCAGVTTPPVYRVLLSGCEVKK